ncbi:hypothetical protein Actkin_02577 [Actinokineospora sp. UTMC 2448]|nr:hypothetical protein Actkin_02577 [Actinokineospora sp. UTMC 2448]
MSQNTPLAFTTTPASSLSARPTPPFNTAMARDTPSCHHTPSAQETPSPRGTLPPRDMSSSGKNLPRRGMSSSRESLLPRNMSSPRRTPLTRGSLSARLPFAPGRTCVQRSQARAPLALASPTLPLRHLATSAHRAPDRPLENVRARRPAAPLNTFVSRPDAPTSRHSAATPRRGTPTTRSGTSVPPALPSARPLIANGRTHCGTHNADLNPERQRGYLRTGAKSTLDRSRPLSAHRETGTTPTLLLDNPANCRSADTAVARRQVHPGAPPTARLPR